MSTNKYIVTGIVVALVLGVASVLGFQIHLGSSSLVGSLNNQYIEQYIAPIRYNGGYNSQLPIQTSGTFTALGAAVFSGSVSYSVPPVSGSVLATTTPASMTMKQSDLQVSTILMNPTVGSITVTLPATSTLTSFITVTGQRQTTVFCNATTTPGFLITIAAGTGMNVSIATGTNSSTIAQGSLKCANLTFIRTANTDVDVLMEPSI